MQKVSEKETVEGVKSMLGFCVEDELRAAKGNEMEVYITYEKDGFGGTRVDRVFEKHEDAIDFIIENKFGNAPYYIRMTEEARKVAAAKFIDEYSVQ